MATLTLTSSFGNDWPPDALAGGIITSRTATTMTYTSERGYTITLRGTGFTYDDDGLPSGGTVTRTTVALGAVTFADYAGVSVDFGRAGMMLFGYDRNNGNHQNPDPFAFIEIMLRGNDVVTGSAGDDDVRGSYGNDIINTGGGNDYVGDEQAGNDTMNGGDGWDTLSFDEAVWRWDAFRGVNLDALTGIALDCFGTTDHFSNFERFKDSLYADTLKGSNIEEESFSITRGNDIVDGRGGFDWADYSGANDWGAKHGVKVNLGTGVAIDSWRGTDTLANIEGVFGTSFADTITGTGADETFQSGAGVDVVNMGGGQDRLVFWDVGRNNDGGHGITFDFNLANNVVDDGYGNTENALGVEEVIGSRFNDRLTGNGAKNWLGGNDGNDTINGGGGEDDLWGEWGSDRISGGGGNDHISGGGDNDTLTGNAGGDQFNFDWDLADIGVDTITDFQVGIDNIWIGSWWGGGFVNDFLVANQFRSGAGVTSANTATQRLIYNTTTGDLFFDADGTGGTAAVKFATLSNHAALTFDDFNVFL